MKALTKIAEGVWQFSGYAVLSIPKYKNDNEPRITFPSSNWAGQLLKIGANALPIFKKKKDAAIFKRGCVQKHPDQRHRIAKAVLTVANCFTEKEIKELRKEIK